MFHRIGSQKDDLFEKVNPFCSSFSAIKKQKNGPWITLFKLVTYYIQGTIRPLLHIISLTSFLQAATSIHLHLFWFFLVNGFRLFPAFLFSDIALRTFGPCANKSRFYAYVPPVFLVNQFCSFACIIRNYIRDIFMIWFENIIKPY